MIAHDEQNQIEKDAHHDTVETNEVIPHLSQNPIYTASSTNFGKQTFVEFINSLYVDTIPTTDTFSPNPLTRMQKNVKLLLNMNCYSANFGKDNSIANIKWGYYQAMLAGAWQCKWPDNTWMEWQKSIPKVRQSLKMVANYQGVDGQEDCHTTLKNRCDLLDALIQRCFNEPASRQTCPGIPMRITISGKCEADPTRAFHDIRFHWDLDSDGVPIMLHLTMICPFGS
ncbi:MAG: hypothetical protein WCC64_22955 [Aliidongia sp.]